MFIRVMLGILGLLVSSQNLAAQDPQPPINDLESQAMAAALERFVGPLGPHLRIVLDPAIAHANEAPGGPGSTRRDASRNSYLTQTFGARVQDRSSVIICDEGCRLRDADIFVTLSQPEVTGPDAKVTVTMIRPTKRGVQDRVYYHTVNVFLRRQGSGWRVVGFKTLGIS